MDEEGNLKDEIVRMRKSWEELMESGKAKKFKIPFRARIGKRFARDNYVTICHINDNREADFIKVPIKEGTVNIKGCPRLATTDYMLTYKGKPFMILPEWSVKPFSPADNYEDTVKTSMASAGYRLLLNIMKSEGISQKKKIGWGLSIGALVIVGIIVYFIIKGG